MGRHGQIATKDRRFRRGLALLLAFAPFIALMVTLPIVTAPQARAQTPGVPAPPTTIFSENFENGIGAFPVSLFTYTGANGEKYTADSAWQENCNGVVVNFNMGNNLPFNCNAGPFGMQDLRAMTQAIGILRGLPDPTANNALAAYTDTGNDQAVNPGARKVQFQTQQFPLPTQKSNSKHFILFGVDAASVQCIYSHPLLQFNLLNGVTATPAGGVIDTCTDPRGMNITLPLPPQAGAPPGGTLPIHVGTYLTSAAIPFTGTTLGLQLVNNQGSGLGNDSAIDNISILDATPQLTKSFSPATQVAGLPSTLTFTITNTSDLLPKPGWSFTDTLPSGLHIANPASTSTTCSNGSIIAPTGSGSVTATGNLVSGQVSCTFTVNVTAAAGTYTNGASNVTSSGLLTPPSASVTFVPPDPKITVTKTPSPATATTAGTTVNYSFRVTNTGNVDLSNVTLTDAQAPPAGGLASGPTCPSTTLAVGASMTCTATYVITQTDVNHGAVNDTATVTGSPPAILGLPPATGTANATVTISAAPALSLTKTVSPGTVTKAGDTVTYTFTVKNTGNVTVHGIDIAETAFSGSGALSPITCLATTLAPNATTTCTATYTITQADMNAGTVTNTAHAAGLAPDGSAVTSPSSSTTVTATQAPALSLVKSASGPPSFNAGQVITYTFEVTNTGNVTVHGIAIDETAFTGTGTLSPITCTATTLAPGQQTTCTATYTLTVADIDRGEVTNTAHAAGTAPGGGTVTSPPSTVSIPQVQSPALGITKTASPATVTAAGTTVTYSFTVTNTGNVTVHGITIVETAFSGTGTVSAITCPVTTLAPGEHTICTASYAITQADMDAGHVTNTAHATGTAPNNATVTSPSATAMVTATQTPVLALTKTASPATVTTAGTAVTYTFHVTNTGNVTVHAIAIAETAFSGTGALSAITCTATTLAPGASTNCTATYTVTQADINAGQITNTAHAAGTAPEAAPVTSPPASATVTVTQAVTLALSKTASPATVTAAGTVVTYSFHVTNTGNVTVHGIAIDETAFTGTGTPSAIFCQATTLAPGASTTCTATYAVTQADVDAGEITNTAHATGLAPSLDTVTSPFYHGDGDGYPGAWPCRWSSRRAGQRRSPGVRSSPTPSR